MGLYLIGFVTLASLWNLFLVVVGLGMVIFVHELGHFVVAKLSGVRVDKFYLGFDIAGWKLARFRLGETEYGIGVFPLGGYVKMLGQEDNPGKLREELERARLNPAPTESSGEAETEGSVAEAEAALYHPRSYLAKSVPARMAIISAGVIMNLIFAFVMAVMAFWFGVEQVACGVGEVAPGESGWRAGLRPGDEILEIAGKRTPLFRDLMAAISLGDVQDGVPLLIRRPGVEKPFTLVVFPDQTRGKPTVGITAPESLNLWTEGTPAIPGSAAAEAKPPLESGDQVIAAAGAPVKSQAALEAELVGHAAEPVEVTVLRPGQSIERKGQKKQQEVKIHIPTRPFRQLGLTIDDGPIVAIQDGSPAAKAGLKPGDRIEQIDGRPAGDALRWEAELRRRAGQEVRLGVRRNETKKLETIAITPRAATWLEWPFMPNSAVSVPSLGIALKMGNQVIDVASGGPAASAGLRQGDVLTKAEWILPAGAKQGPTAIKVRPVALGDQQRNWPFFFYALQNMPNGTGVRLTTSDKRTIELEPTKARDWFNPDRGIGPFERQLITEEAKSVGDAMGLGWRETADSTMLVFSVLAKLGTQISPRELSGPIEIFKAASQAAQEGMTRLFLFLTVLSANLAVVNFLPIPVLDGGHMLFLAYEGIRGKPASERVQLVLTYAGLFFILGLMVFVIGLDLDLISRPR